VWGRAGGWREGGPLDLAALESFVAFIGHPCSGHSLVGARLSDHPPAVVSHELDAFGLLARGIDRAFVAGGAAWSGYSYKVPGDRQGRHDRLRVIGDKKGGRISNHEAFTEDPVRELAALEGWLGLPRHEEHLVAAAALVRNEPARARDALTWPPGMQELVAKRAAAVPWLAGYDFA